MVGHKPSWSKLLFSPANFRPYPFLLTHGCSGNGTMISPRNHMTLSTNPSSRNHLPSSPLLPSDALMRSPAIYSPLPSNPSPAMAFMPITPTASAPWLAILPSAHSAPVTGNKNTLPSLMLSHTAQPSLTPTVASSDATSPALNTSSPPLTVLRHYSPSFMSLNASSILYLPDLTHHKSTSLPH